MIVINPDTNENESFPYDLGDMIILIRHDQIEILYISFKSITHLKSYVLKYS